MRSADQSQSKKNQGRRKVNMGKIEKESNLQVTFSKRRVGLFKKASELCTLTGAEAAVLVFSPGNKPHSFGNPDFNTVADRFLDPNSPQASHVNPNSQTDQEYLAHLESLIEAEKAKGEELERVRKACQKEKWVPPEELSYQQLEQLRGAVMDFGKNVEKAVNPVVEYTYNPFVSDFDANSSDDATTVPYGEGNNTVIPYDQGAIGDDEPENAPHQFNTGYGHGSS